MTAERLALGTVQFGQPYGVANRTGQVPADEVERILHSALAAGLDTLDTAAAYGSSEEVLGAIGVSDWKVVTKLPPDAPATGIGGWVEESLEQSLARLRVDAIHGVMAHRAGHLQGPAGVELIDCLVELRAAGTIERIGVSVYGPTELDDAWRSEVDLVQAPFSVFDHRIRDSGWLDRLDEAGVEVHTRSAFLQGLLLMADRPPAFDKWRDRLDAWDGWVGEQGVTPVAAALGAVLSESRIDRVVVGVDSLAHLDEIVKAARQAPVAAPDTLSTDDLDLVDPSRWELS